MFNLKWNKKGPNQIELGVVFKEKARFAGWPANNGIWSWGDEILVGLVESDFKETGGMHTSDSNSAKNKYGRSKDGGNTWVIEDAYEHGQTAWAHDNNVSKEKAVNFVTIEKWTIIFSIHIPQ